MTRRAADLLGFQWPSGAFGKGEILPTNCAGRDTAAPTAHSRLSIYGYRRVYVASAPRSGELRSLKPPKPRSSPQTAGRDTGALTAHSRLSIYGYRRVYVASASRSAYDQRAQIIERIGLRGEIIQASKSARSSSQTMLAVIRQYPPRAPHLCGSPPRSAYLRFRGPIYALAASLPNPSACIRTNFGDYVIKDGLILRPTRASTYLSFCNSSQKFFKTPTNFSFPRTALRLQVDQLTSSPCIFSAPCAETPLFFLWGSIRASDEGGAAFFNSDVQLYPFDAPPKLVAPQRKIGASTNHALEPPDTPRISYRVEGVKGAGGKYEDRSRMTQFNLSKVDRTVLHKRIASADTSRNIQPAREVHAHKGLEDVEGVDDEVPNLRERKLERRQREEEKRERELLYRCQLGGPPRVPIHALTPTEEVFGGQEMSLEPK
ncbi:hypothetical protein C8F04DRAFT_1175863 [Mycena alexandri]|uniref:Uncharacterized protein n=1 Tax=Mycena alexandri TaxID=1745969 RepID=A0AAD6TCB7_9AGAR|nr:hypothetical protein C8F04DRAFT_1175863 [Mycena alexandri]